MGFSEKNSLTFKSEVGTVAQEIDLQVHFPNMDIKWCWACRFSHLLLVNLNKNLKTVSKFIKLSHGGFPEITHFPDSVLKEKC